MIFPLYFDADPIVKSGDDSDFTAATSSVELDGSSATVAIGLNDAVKVGTCVNFHCTDATNAVTVTFDTSAGGASRNVVTFAAGVSASCLWTGDAGWRVVQLDGAESVVA